MRDRAPITELPIEGGVTDDVIVLGDCAEPRGGMHQCTAGGDSLEVAPITSEAAPVVEKETVGRATRPAVDPLSGRAASVPPAAPHAPEEPCVGTSRTVRAARRHNHGRAPWAH